MIRRSIVRAVLMAGALALASGCGGRGGNVLNIFIWSEYLPDEIVQEFEKRTGVRVRYDTYDSNEALLEKLQSGVADYDLVVPSDYMVQIMIAEGLLKEIDKSRISTWSHLDAKFLNKPFDPDNRYSMPYFWGTTGIGYNKQKFPEGVHSWAALFDEANAGRILMLDDVREVFAVALKYLGRSANETDPDALRQAADLLKRQKRLVKTYNSGDFHNILAAGDVDLAHGYNGQLASVVAAQPDRLGYAVPVEGAVIWMDSLCIPKKARNVENAHAFMSFVMEPEINARIVNAVRYASANKSAKKWIDPAILADEAVYPPEEIIDRCEFLRDVGDAAVLYDQLWTEIKAQ